MRAAALGACLWLTAAAVAQPPEDTVQWSAALASSAPLAPGGTASITVTGTIAQGWHVYALEQLPGGPIPLAVSLGDNTLASADGKPSGSKPESVFDKRFGLKTQFYSGTVMVQLPVRLAGAAAAGSQQLAVKVRFQSCSAQECRPPATVRLSVPVEVSAHE
jgi:thiol:disulfide interchange protein DsbD